MVVRVATVAFEGIEARPVDVQVQIANGNVAFTVIDLHVDVPANLMLPPPAEVSREVAERVAAARNIQVARYAGLGLPVIVSNAAAPANVIEAIAQPDARGSP